MTRPRRRRSSELTSLVDVLFILLFATLVQQRRAESAVAPAPEPAEADASPAPEPEPEAAPVAADAGPPPEDPHAAAREVGARLDTDEVILVAVDAAGTVSAIERGGETIDVGASLLRETGDARVVAYAAEGAPDARLCRVVADALGAGALDRALILVATERPMRELGYALVRGLRTDVARCLDDAGAYALLVRPDEIPRKP